MRVPAERARTHIEADHEEVPARSTRQVEEGLGHTVGRDTGYIAEDEGHHHRSEYRADKEPRVTKDGLLIGGLQVTASHDPQQIAITPYLLEVDIKELLVRGYKQFLLSQEPK